MTLGILQVDRTTIGIFTLSLRVSQIDRSESEETSFTHCNCSYYRAINKWQRATSLTLSRHSTITHNHILYSIKYSCGLHCLGSSRARSRDFTSRSLRHGMPSSHSLSRHVSHSVTVFVSTSLYSQEVMGFTGYQHTSLSLTTLRTDSKHELYCRPLGQLRL